MTEHQAKQLGAAQSMCRHTLCFCQGRGGVECPATQVGDIIWSTAQLTVPVHIKGHLGPTRSKTDPLIPKEDKADAHELSCTGQSTSGVSWPGQLACSLFLAANWHTQLGEPAGVSCR